MKDESKKKPLGQVNHHRAKRPIVLNLTFPCPRGPSKVQDQTILRNPSGDFLREYLSCHNSPRRYNGVFPGRGLLVNGDVRAPRIQLPPSYVNQRRINQVEWVLRTGLSLRSTLYRVKPVSRSFTYRWVNHSSPSTFRQLLKRENFFYLDL